MPINENTALYFHYYTVVVCKRMQTGSEQTTFLITFSGNLDVFNYSFKISSP